MSSLPSAVVFDLDDTLIIETEHAKASFATTALMAEGVLAEDVATEARATARRLWQASEHFALGHALGIASWEALWASFEGGHACLERLREWAPEFRVEVWRSALLACSGDVGQAAELAAGFVDAQSLPHAAIPGAFDLVRRIESAGESRLGLLTNGPPDIQRLKLAQSGLENCFSTVVISGLVGVGKPDPAVFQLVLEGLGSTADETVMIGDSWNRDIEGAVGAGMRAIWVSNGRTPPHALPGVQTVHTTADAAELLGC